MFRSAVPSFALLAPWFRRFAVLLALAALGGCATGPDPRDPLEPWNRRVSNFNEAADSLVLKPAAIAYREAVPPLARTGVNNFFGNLADAWSAANTLLQLRLHHAAENWLRFGVNTFFGLGGLLDVATDLGIERHRADAGQTLGRWGVPTGPYLVLPILGPSTVRDTVALPADYWGDPLSAVKPGSLQTGLQALRIVEVRSNLLRASSVLDNAALDKYSFTRDAYLQRRQALIWRPADGEGGHEGDNASDGDSEDFSR
ncbi:VacJ family lipoprotein [Ramlibacter sp. AN1015]|uniref:MlaA family lipoprotein n=1 Tax=Ramlibacter sp. AN1015 TaxID=3133428 RepID=UPI0030C3416F